MTTPRKRAISRDKAWTRQADATDAGRALDKGAGMHGPSVPGNVI